MPDLNPEAVAGVADPELRQLLHDHWEAAMRRWPTWASELGDRRYDHLLPDSSPEAHEAERRRLDGWLARTAALDGEAMNPVDRVTLAMLEEQFHSTKERQVCAFERWAVSPWSNPLDRLNRLPEHRTIDSPVDGANLRARYRAVPDYVDGVLANLRLGLAEGRVANGESVRRTIEMLDRELAKSDDDWSVSEPALAEHPDWPPAELEGFRSALMASVRQDLRPAVARYREFLQVEILPAARPADQAGMGALPEGEACYQAEIRHFTTLRRSATAIHQLGLDELAAIHGEFQALGQRLWGTSEVSEIFERLRTDPDLFFETPGQVQAKAEEALVRAEAAMPAFFGRLPGADCVVRPIPDYEAPYSTIAYYRRPAPDGSKPGEYFVNTHAPTTRPRHEAEVLAFHESIPGHHLQIAIAQELPELPAFRRHVGMTAYVEGWALYTERLADEMGLYSSDLDRLGMLSFDAWRASRLVVDTGLHALGWSRAQAMDFLEDNTPLAVNNIDNEVDRYLNWPGQALAYKTGQIEIRELRAAAEQRLGARFELSAFHDQVLSKGAVSLPLLRQQIEGWLASEEAN